MLLYFKLMFMASIVNGRKISRNGGNSEKQVWSVEEMNNDRLKRHCSSPTGNLH